jgi:hypothetical protein
MVADDITYSLDLCQSLSWIDHLGDSGQRLVISPFDGHHGRQPLAHRRHSGIRRHGSSYLPLRRFIR